ncbi:MAG: macro domain-containing protein [Hyphomicrobiaceae bacterium]
MPFGLKQAANGVSFDFDQVYFEFIKPTVEGRLAEYPEYQGALGFECIRSDQWNASGSVHREMIQHLVHSDVVIIDITTHNANVFYELGVRHSFRQYTTVLIRNEKYSIPFNIAGMRVVDYNMESSETVEASRVKLADCIRESFSIKDNDSLVHEVLRDVRLTMPPRPILEREIVDQQLKTNTTVSVGYVTGDILNIDTIDVWVNAENTKMQMARFHDGSVSSNIRYFGARLNRSGFVTSDIISDALRKSLRGGSHVEAGTVVATSPGSLGRSNNLRAILHVAAMHGVPGRGYEPVHNIEHCVWWTLEELDRINQQWRVRPWLKHPFDRPLLTSILFPMFGTRSGILQPQEHVDRLFRAAAVYFEMHEKSTIRSVRFLAYTETDRILCESALGTLRRLKKIPDEPKYGQGLVSHAVQNRKMDDGAIGTIKS